MNRELVADSNSIIRHRLIVKGVVQGVGFRPFVFGLAQRYQLHGFVGNNSAGVFIEAEGKPAAVEAFTAALRAETPPLAFIESVTSQSIAVQDSAQFEIVHSEAQEAANTLISPDVCVCDECLQELLDSHNRRYRYPFINCTNCGPRFTIIEDIPYDRPLTTMASFVMCPACQSEYDDPLDRRFHAQPNACPECGPHVWLEMASAEGERPTREAAVDGTIELLRNGKIVAVKGLGGFHLACDAANDEALHLLRERKGRVDKPFAVMARDLETIRGFAIVNAAEEALLTSKERPIVLLEKKPENDLSPLIAPGINFIGVMLPYTPLHVLLLQELPVLVMTSANFSNEPIVKENEEARERLGDLADALLCHNRPIKNRCDDAVVRVVTAQGEKKRAGNLLPIRRSRGYAPFPVRLPFEMPPILATGGELKATFCLTKGSYAYMGQHIGDMGNWETLQAFTQAVAQFQHLFRVDVEAVACDMHPGYLATRWAQEQAGSKRLAPVQHHHAHIAGVMAEHQLDGSEPVIGFAFDGTGYGLDGHIWGGEVLLADYADFERPFHLAEMLLPGGDVSVRRPYRLALSCLWQAGLDWLEELPPVQACSAAEQKLLRQQLQKEVNCVPTSSMGRLFDAVAALIGVRQEITYEGQAAIELENLVDEAVNDRYEFAVEQNVFSAVPLIIKIVADMQNNVPRPVIAAKFHNGVAALILQLSQTLCKQNGLKQVTLSGGVFQNVTLLEKSVRLLQAAGIKPLIHKKVPPNDGGLALGQAVVAGVRLS
ncbi:MAG: carbamoyltransferase HypF [Ardenticatenaceae bacterium]|nr:carbamoyltransferase HypF [Ardenticatenaceae bacterium]